jgi:intron-binding protein aquarius
MIIMVNEKFRTNVRAWGMTINALQFADRLLDCFTAKPQQFPAFFSKVLDLAVSKDKLTMKERTWVVIFLVHCYQSIENELVRKESLRSACWLARKVGSHAGVGFVPSHYGML